MRRVVFLILCLLVQGTGQAGTPSPAIPPGRPALPLIEIPGTHRQGAALAVIISGAGGWAPLVRTLIEDLAANDLPVVGLNAQLYFWQKRTPEEAAADLALILRHYLPAWRRQKAVLIGYSMGAEVLPFLFNRLPPDLQRQVTAVVLIGPGPMASFEFHLLYLLGVGYGWGDLPVLPEILKVSGGQVLCLYGREEQHSPCRDLPPDRNHLWPIELPGGHHFDGNYHRLAEVVREELGRLNHCRSEN
jgi:type IV secretory pathway VirJ component